MLIELLKQFNIDFCAVNSENITDIVFMLPYFPYANYPKNCARIDAFYIASNTLYNKVKEIKKVLQENGYQLVDRHLQLKKVAEIGGLGSILHNQLLVSSKYGSRTTLQSISLIGQYEYIATGKVDKICDSCLKCDTTCPVGALSKGIFEREKCIRHLQDFPTEYTNVVSGRVLGCEECQNACFYNRQIDKIEMPEYVQQVFDYENLFEMLKSGKKGLTPLAELIGKNLARPTYIFNLIVNSLISAKNFEYTKIIKTFAKSDNEAIRDKTNFYLDYCSRHND